MRLVGVDFGGKRIGLASIDPAVKLPCPLPNLEASGTLARDAEAIRKVMESEKAEVVVIGLPLDLAGETKMSRICRMLGERLGALGVQVQFVDESMTSQHAENTMKAAGLSAARARKKVDSEAACRILERFMEESG